MPDVTDTDDDGDGIPDDTEKIDGTNSKDPNSADSVITPLDDQTGTVGEAITPVTVKVDKVPTDGSVTVTGLPDGVTYDPATGQITGIPKKKVNQRLLWLFLVKTVNQLWVLTANQLQKSSSLQLRN